MPYKNKDERNARNREKYRANPEKYRSKGKSNRLKKLATRREQARAWYALNRERRAEYARSYREANAVKLKAQARARYAKNKEKHKARGREQYRRDADSGIRRPSLYPAPSRKPPAVCECCGKAPARRRLALDHCHDTRRFRGWLCGNCNVGIGMLGDTLEGVLHAVKYLRRAEGST